jgi:redox-sensitive bicupin YhaK (pirin superfamily)
MGNTVFHPASTRIHANLGWLEAYRSFHPVEAPEPSRHAFGALLILNEDIVAAGRGFGRHPHQNVEIITLPLRGALVHEDSLGHTAVIRAGDVQVMSAGTGIVHSEKNHSAEQPVHFLQILLATNQPNRAPRYEQQPIAPGRPNQFQQLAGPCPAATGVGLRQQAWLQLGELTAGAETTYEVQQPGNGVYALVLSGRVRINAQSLGPFDGFGTWDTPPLRVQADSAARVLLLEVPMLA